MVFYLLFLLKPENPAIYFPPELAEEKITQSLRRNKQRLDRLRQMLES